MDDNDRFFTKLNDLKGKHEEARADGYRLEPMRGYFPIKRAPMARVPIDKDQREREWQALMDADAADPVLKHFGQPTSILTLYLQPNDRRVSAADPDKIPASLEIADSFIRASCTPAVLRLLWDQWFATYDPEQYRHPWYSTRFTGALKTESARRGIPCRQQALSCPSATSPSASSPFATSPLA